MSWIPQAEDLFFYYFLTFELALLCIFILQVLILVILIGKISAPPEGG